MEKEIGVIDLEINSVVSLFEMDLIGKIRSDRTYTTTCIICKNRIKDLCATYLSILKELPEWVCTINRYNSKEIQFSLFGMEHGVRFVSSENYLKGMGIDFLYVFDDQPLNDIFPVVMSGRGGKIYRIKDKVTI